MPELSEAPFVNILDPTFVEDPEAVLDGLRDQAPIVQTPLGALVFGRPQVISLLSDRRVRSAVRDLTAFQGIDDQEVLDLMDGSILALDGEEHLRLRRLANRAFTPRAVNRHREDMRVTLAGLLDPIVRDGRCEFMSAVSDHYPIMVMCHVLGVPDEDHGDFSSWNNAITWALSLSLGEHLEEVKWGMAQLDAYAHDTIARRREAMATGSTTPDLITAMLEAEEADDRLTDEEVAHMIVALLFAGYDTTRNQLGLGMWLFAQHPDQWEALRTDPSLAPQAVEEMMRHEGAIGGIPRFTIEDIELDGWRIPAGTMVQLGTAAANHDPAFFTDPQVFDITVEREPHHTFGGGPHYCLGASLARAEMAEALPMLAEAMPGLALDGEPTWRDRTGIFGPETLPLRWE